MKRALSLILLVSFSFSQFKNLSDNEKLIYYESHKKNPGVSAAYWLLFPSLGHFYLEDYKKGKLYIVANILAVGIPTSFAIATDTSLGGNTKNIYGTKTNEDDLLWHILVSYGIVRTIELFDVISSTKKYNEKLYKNIFGKEPPSISLNLQPTFKGANLNLTYSF